MTVLKSQCTESLVTRLCRPLPMSGTRRRSQCMHTEWIATLFVKFFWWYSTQANVFNILCPVTHSSLTNIQPYVATQLSCNHAILPFFWGALATEQSLHGLDILKQYSLSDHNWNISLYPKESSEGWQLSRKVLLALLAFLYSQCHFQQLIVSSCNDHTGIVSHTVQVKRSFSM